MTPTTHRHAILERCDRAVLTACDTCVRLPFALRTRQGVRLRIQRFYADRDAAMSAYQQARTKGATNAGHV